MQQPIQKEAKQQSSQDDVIDFLKEKKGFVIKSFNWWGPLRSRVWAFVAMLKGYFSFYEFCQLLLPSFFGDKSKLMDRYYEFLCDEYEKEYPSSPKNCVNLFGHKFKGPNYYRVIGFINEIIVLDQYHASQFLKKDSIVIDAGAYIGTFSIFAARMAPQGRIYSFEPVAEPFQYLKENVKYYPQITCENSGLGDGIYQKNIILDPKSSGASFFEDSFSCSEKFGSKKYELANVITIDAFVAKHGISRIDFIKIDAEGYEARILKGAREAIKKFKPVVAMSAYHNPDDKENLPRILKEICPDYICELHKDHEEDFICYIEK